MRRRLLLVIFSFLIVQAVWAKLEIKGIPYAYYGSDTGLGLGGFSQLNLLDTNTNLIWNLYAEVNFTTKQEQTHKLILKIPLTGFNDLPLDLTFSLIYEKIPFETYYGVNNDTSIIENYTNFYLFHRITPYFSIIAEAAFFETGGDTPYLLKGLVDLNIENYKILPSADLPTNGTAFLFLDNPNGVEGGLIINPLIGIAFDGRDNPYSSTRGTYHEASLELSSTAWGSSYDYSRFTFINSGFLTLLPHLVLAERIMWDVLWGDVPFFKTYRYGGLNPKRSIGGRFSMRGIPFYRASDNVKLINNLELRWTPLHFPLLGDEWKVGLVAFWDSGRVWDSISNMNLSEFHNTWGLGLRAHWGSDFVVAADFGFWQGEISGIYIQVGEIF